MFVQSKPEFYCLQYCSGILTCIQVKNRAWSSPSLPSPPSLLRHVFYIVLYCTILYYTVQYCTVLYCTVSSLQFPPVSSPTKLI